MEETQWTVFAVQVLAAVLQMPESGVDVQYTLEEI